MALSYPTDTYHERTFHRKFEATYGYLTPDQFPPIDYSDRNQIEMLFPAYRRFQLVEEKSKKKVERGVDLYFNLKTPDNSRPLFSNCRLLIEPRKRCALFGINGSGKTTLFHAIANGQIREFPPSMHVHHMKELEHNEKADSMSVLDTIMCSHPFRRVLVCLEAHLKELIAAEAEKDKSSDRYAKLVDNLAYIEVNLRSCEAHTTEKRAKQMLRVLGFDEVGEQAPVSSLSGGLRMRVALACAFIINPDLLLLDEPTNHLDMPSVLWLENKLRGYPGSYVLVTHDRTLLENVVTSVMLIQDLAIEYFTCGFKEFEKVKEKKDVEREDKIDKFLQKHRNLAPEDPLYRTRMEYKEWLQVRHDRKIMLAGKFTFKAPKELPLDDPTTQQSQADISLIKVENVRFSYDPAKGLPFIFDKPISYEVKIGTRVGIMGPNGAGKSTFLKLITGKLQPTEGKITTHPSYTLAYFGQHSTKELKLDMTPLEFMTASFPQATVGELKSHLTKTSVSGDTMETRMESLSFSQRSCVIFAKLTFVPPHLLIMDEPTNFLDLDSVDALISAVNKFSGGLIIVTHNRDFLKKLGKTFLSILPSNFLEFPTMKEAERATYSFITALEAGLPVDFKSAIQENRGGGAIHTEEYLEESANRLMQQQLEAKAKADAEAAKIAAEAAKAAEEKEAQRLAKLALQKSDWAVGDVCWVPGQGKYEKATVVRVIPNMGVNVKLDKDGKVAMVDAHKLRVENPRASTTSSNSSVSDQKSKPTEQKKQPPVSGKPNSNNNNNNGGKVANNNNNNNNNSSRENYNNNNSGRGGRGGGRGGRQ